MKHKLVSLALTAMLLLSACTAPPAAANTDAADPLNSAAPVSESVLPEVNKESAVVEITASLADYAAPEYISISNANSITEIILFNPETAVQLIKAKASGNSPDEWAYTKDELAALSAELPPLAGTEQTAIYLKDEKDGEIYLTVLNGSPHHKIKHQALLRLRSERKTRSIRLKTILHLCLSPMKVW